MVAESGDTRTCDRKKQSRDGGQFDAAVSQWQRPGCYQDKIVSTLPFACLAGKDTHCTPSTDLMIARTAALRDSLSLGQAMMTCFTSAMDEANFCASLCAS